MAVAATGFFDGVHLGHRFILETLLREAEKRSEESLAITFWPHPRQVLDLDADSLRLLNTREERRARLEEIGLSRIEELRFDKAFSAMTASDYVKMLKESYSVDELVIGYDTRMGCDRKTPEEIGAIALGYGMKVLMVSEFGAPVSSSKIRKSISEGDVLGAASMLGYRYSLKGEVVHGNKIGRTLGFPTANLEVGDSNKIFPSPGAYLCEVYLGGEAFYGMTNVGNRPTLGGDGCLVIETHIFGFNDDIYGRTMELRFIERLRGETRFDSLEALKIQLLTDSQNCNLLINQL